MPSLPAKKIFSSRNRLSLPIKELFSYIPPSKTYVSRGKLPPFPIINRICFPPEITIPSHPNNASSRKLRNDRPLQSRKYFPLADILLPRQHYFPRRLLCFWLFPFRHAFIDLHPIRSRLFPSIPVTGRSQNLDYTTASHIPTLSPSRTQRPLQITNRTSKQAWRIRQIKTTAVAPVACGPAHYHTQSA